MKESFSDKSLKICALFGSPNKNGFDARLLEAFLKNAADAEVKLFDVYSNPIPGCNDCGRCQKDGLCSADDGGFFEAFEECDIFVAAFPIYFLSLPSNAKAVLDRFQKYFSVRFSLGIKNYLKKRKAAVLISTCGSDSKQGFEIIEQQWKMAFSVSSTALASTVFVENTDTAFISQAQIDSVADKAFDDALKTLGR